MRLNGWQRLWVVLSVLFGVYVTYIERDVYPKDLPPVPAETFPDVDGYESHIAICDAFKGVATPAQYESCTQKVVKPPLSRFLDRGTYQIRVQEYQTVGQRRREFIGFILKLWLVPCAVLYVFGLVVGWVINGFRRPTS